MAPSSFVAYNWPVTGILKKALGVLCIVAGIVFGILPFVPGILLVFVGLELLGAPIVPWERIRALRDRSRRGKSDEEY